MPKPKPDQIIRHEIVLGKTEREMMDTLVMSGAVNNVGSGMGNLLEPFLQMSPAVLGALISSLIFALYGDDFDLPPLDGGGFKKREKPLTVREMLNRLSDEIYRVTPLTKE